MALCRFETIHLLKCERGSRLRRGWGRGEGALETEALRLAHLHFWIGKLEAEKRIGIKLNNLLGLQRDSCRNQEIPGLFVPFAKIND